MITYIIGFISGLILGAVLQRYIPQLQQTPKDPDHNTSDDWCWCNPEVEVLENGNKIIKHRNISTASAKKNIYQLPHPRRLGRELMLTQCMHARMYAAGRAVMRYFNSPIEDEE